MSRTTPQRIVWHQVAIELKHSSRPDRAINAKRASVAGTYGTSMQITGLSNRVAVAAAAASTLAATLAA